eukprot:80064_1
MAVDLLAPLHSMRSSFVMDKYGSFVLLGFLLPLLSLSMFWLSNHFKNTSRTNSKYKTVTNWTNIKEMNAKYDRFYKKTLSSAKYMMAPMVLQSDLPFRMMCRKYACSVCYSPMIRASEIIYHYNKYGNLNKSLRTHKLDRPLIVQLCGNDPKQVAKAGQIIESLNICDAIDINLGCPQRCAQVEHFGAFLLDSPDIVRSMIRELVQQISLPICAKIRILPSIQDTLCFTDMLIGAGVSMVAIHGRRRERIHHKGPADLECIRNIKKHYVSLGVAIPIISNGNIVTTQDVKDALRFTTCDGIMSACGILRNPYIFDCKRESFFRYRNGIKISWEYLKYVERYGVVDRKSINDHLLTFCEEYLEGDANKNNWDIRKLLRQNEKVYTLPQLIACVEVLEVRLKMKPSITKTCVNSIDYPYGIHGIDKSHLIALIRKNKVNNGRLNRKRKRRKGKLEEYNKRVNALFEQNQSDSD